MSISGIATPSPLPSSSLHHASISLQPAFSHLTDCPPGASHFRQQRKYRFQRHAENRAAPVVRDRPVPRLRRNAAVPATPIANTTNAIAPKPLSTSARADDLFALAYTLALGDTQEQAKDKLYRNDQDLHRSWRNLTDITELGWTRADQDQPPSPLDIAHAQNEFTIHLRSHPALDDSAARSLAHFYLFQRPVAIIEEPALASLYQSVLQRGLHWIDLDAVRARQMSPAQILHAVCRYRGQPVAADSTLHQRLQNYRDVIADEAALIYFNAQPGCAMQADCDAVARNAPIHAIRAQFATALIDEWQDAGIGIALLPSAPIAPMHAKFWYDGFSLQNARDKHLEELVAELFDGGPYAKEAPIIQHFIDQASDVGHLPGYPGKATIGATRRNALIRAMHADMSALSRYEERPGTVDFAGIWLTRNETAAVVAKRMHDLMLGTHYPKCTVLDALETTVLRLGPLHDIAFNAYDQPAELVNVYNRLGQAWDRDPRFAIAPSPYAGQYLTRCRNVLYLLENTGLTRDRQIVLQVANNLFPALHSAMESSSRQLLLAELDYWSMTIAQFAGVQRPMPAIDATRYLTPARLALLSGVRASVRVRKNAVETIRFGNSTDLQRQLHDYVEEELPALAPLPVYDEDFQIDRILRRQLDMSDTDIKTRRPVRFALQSIIGAPIKVPVKNLTPPEEFGIRLRLSASAMRFGPLTINTVEELENARKAAVAALMEDRIVRAKSTEIMRRHGIPQHPENVRAVRQSLANSLVGIATPTSLTDGLLADLDRLFGSPTLRAMVDAIASGEPRRIFSLLPFVVPLYDIVKGIGHRNWTLVGSGATHLLEDAALTALGLAAEKIMLAQLARGADALLALRRPTAAALETPVIAETPFNARDGITAHEPAAQTLPKAAEAAALMPDRRVQLTLYLIDEKRWVAVKPVEGAFAETDLRGNVLHGAPVIFGDIASRRGYRLMRRPNALDAAAAVEIPDLMQSATVIDVLATSQRLARLPNIRSRRPNPKKIIKALFSLADNAPSENLRQGLQRIYTRYRTYAQFEQFWERVYQRSDTAVEFLNAAYDRLPFTGNAEISFHAEQARTIGRDVHLLGESALADQYYVSLDGTTRFQWPRMLIHEILHALGETADTNMFNKRGETIFRTDRILFEMGYAEPIPARLAYRMPPVFSHNEAAHQLWAMHLLDIYDTVVLEDLLIDRKLAVARTVSESTMILGQKVSERITVRQALELVECMRTIPKFGLGDTERLFQLAASSFDSSVHSDFIKMLRKLITESKTLRELAHAWFQQGTYARARVRTIDFGLREGPPFRPVSAHAISDKRIWINTEPLYYFSERGFAPMDHARRYTGVIVDYFLGEIMPQVRTITWPDRFRSRGLGVLLENEILKEIHHPSSPRVCLELSPCAEGRHRDLTAVRRADDTEWDFLWQTVRERLAADGKAAGNDLLGLTEPAPR
jgi:hypothetical protein